MIFSAWIILRFALFGEIITFDSDDNLSSLCFCFAVKLNQAYYVHK